MDNRITFSATTRVPNQVAFVVVLLVGLSVAWFTIAAGEKLIAGFSEKNLRETQRELDLPTGKTPLSSKPAVK